MRKKKDQNSIQPESVDKLGEAEFIVSESQEPSKKSKGASKDHVAYGCMDLDIDEDEMSPEDVFTVIDNVLDEINAGHFDLDPAMIGFDQYSDAIVWSYAKLMAVLTANGYCEHCADLFIQCFAQFTQPSKDDPQKHIPQNIVVLEKADNEIVGFKNRYNQHLDETHCKDDD